MPLEVLRSKGKNTAALVVELKALNNTLETEKCTEKWLTKLVSVNSKEIILL